MAKASAVSMKRSWGPVLQPKLQAPGRGHVSSTRPHYRGGREQEEAAAHTDGTQADPISCEQKKTAS